MKTIEEQSHELIKAHILDPDNSPLPLEQQEELDRVISISRILDKNPILRDTVLLHRAKYSHISNSTAYRDARIAMRIYGCLRPFEYDFWQGWLINDSLQNIKDCRRCSTAADRRIIAMEHANLFKMVGKKPEDLPDPKRNEKHQFYIMVQVNNQEMKIDLDKLEKLPEGTLRELNKAISAGKEITVEDAQQIMDS